MTAQVLSAELSNLIQESKRKNSDLRNAAEKSLQDLKSLHATSEEQLAADLIRRPQFITPFLIACGTKSSRFANPAVICLQRLSVSHGLPKERLGEVLEAFSECTSLGLETQLKILQALPSLLQNYSRELKGDLLRTILQVCSSLQAVKNPAVSGTAVATFQQLVSSVFDNVASEDERSLEVPCVTEVPSEDEPIPVREAAYDAYKVFHDLCAMAEGSQPKFIRISLPQPASLELIESVLNNHGAVFSTHPEQSHLLKSLLMPLLIRFLSEKTGFPITVRTFRIVQNLVRNHLNLLSSECEVALGLLNNHLDPDVSPLWKRIMSMEVFRSLYSEPGLILQLHSLYDEAEGKKHILRDNLSVFVRLSTEKPAAIGLGSQSTAPVMQSQSNDTPAEQAAMEAGAVAGLVSGPSVPSSTTSTIGIGHWSNMRTPCIDHLDKSEAPPFPETYIYSLVLGCITNLSEGLAKFIIPLTVHGESKNKKKGKAQSAQEQQESTPSASDDASMLTPSKRRVSRTQSFRKKTVPQNPLSLEGHKAFPYIKSTAALINDSWPAVLATCSTFLSSALDQDFYRALVRSIQKFTQVAGLLRLSTPRDALLTMLGKNAVPSHVLAGTATSPKLTSTEQGGVFGNAKALLSVDSLVSPASPLGFDKHRRTSVDNSTSLNTRNLLCLRALLNLAIALGPTLEEAWSIVFETLQQADIVLAFVTGKGVRGSGMSQRSEDGHGVDLGSEVTAVQAAASRLFESTVDFPNDAFVSVLEALCGLLHSNPGVRGVPPPTGTRPLHQRRVGSVSGPTINTGSDAQDYMLALGKVGDVAALNLPRLAHYEASESGWGKLVEELVNTLSNRAVPTPARRMAADIMGQIGKDMTKISMAEEELDTRPEVQSTVLGALHSGIQELYKGIPNDESIDEGTVDIHDILLESLKAVLEQCGESLTAGWSSVFSILSSVFHTEKDVTGAPNDNAEDDGQTPLVPRPLQFQTISRRLTRSAFESVQLICSDFLTAIPNEFLATLLDLILRFSSQQQDLNISLSTITFFWNVSDFLPSRSKNISFQELSEATTIHEDIAKEIRALAEKGSIPGLWLLVLLHLTTLSIDARADVRNGSIQTIARIFDNSGDELSPDSWYLCVRSILFALMKSNLDVQRSLRTSSQSPSVEDLVAWNNTSKMILETLSTLLSSYMESIRKHDRFYALWESLAEFHTGYLLCHSHALTTAVYTSISEILARAENISTVGQPAIERMLAVWKAHFPEEANVPDVAPTNQDAFLAYTRTVKEIYRHYRPHTKTETAIEIIQLLKRAVEDSDAAAYSADVDYMTELQKRVMEFLSVLYQDIPGVVPSMLSLLAEFIILPFGEKAISDTKRKPTFVALAKASMTLAQEIVPKHVSVIEIYESGSAKAMLSSLAASIDQKNAWSAAGKKSTTWQAATTAAVVILKSVLGWLGHGSLDKEVLRPLWDEIVLVTERIAHADVSLAPPTAPIAEYESFDVSALASIRDVMTPLLGAPVIADSTRRAYTVSLFRSSLIHPCEPGEIPKADESPLQNLYKVRLGRTFDPAPNPRTNMAYFCFSELGSLVSAHDGSVDRIKLAQAAAPYFILRAALTLKTYIADQPLRGRMPQPYSQRKELLFVLKLIRELDSEPKSIPDAPGVVSTHKKHLHRLYPLLCKAGHVSQQDEEILKEVMDVMEVVGDEFGI